MRWLVVSSALFGSLACSGDASGGGSDSTHAMRTSEVRSDTESNNDQGGVDVFDASTPMRRESSVQRADAGGSQSTDAGTSRLPARDAGKASASRSPRMSEAKGHAELDAGRRRSNASSELDAGKPAEGAARSDDAGVSPVDASRATNNGNCCSVSDQPGCGDTALQACVCAQKPSCCSDAWSEACTRIVAQKFCQIGVRDCVCGSGTDQWQQPQCCETSWDDTCESVATNKCGASSDCK